MNRLERPGITLAIIVSLWFLFSQTAHASIDLGTLEQAAHAYYIGPGLGQLLAYLLIGLAVGGAAMAGVYRIRIRGFLSKLSSRRRTAVDSEAGDDSEEREETD